MSVFTFNGRGCDEFGVKVRSVSRPALPGTKDRYVDVPGMNGSFLFNGPLADREITLDCVVVGSDLVDLQTKFRAISAWLFTNTRKVLTFSDQPDKYYLAKLSGGISIKQTYKITEFELVFNCDPFIYGPKQTFSFISDLCTVLNEGTFEAMPVFTSTFINDANEWKVVFGDKYIRIVHDFKTGDTLTVDCNLGIITVNSLNIISSLDWENSEFFALPPGYSDLTIKPEGVCDTTITFDERWL